MHHQKKDATGEGISRTMTVLFAVVSGCAVGNLYWAQPLLAVIAASFGVSTGSAGILVTTTQIGYAVGILMIVPAGDILDRRKMIPMILAASSVSLAGCFFSTSWATLLVALGFVGLSAVTGQLIAPLASQWANPDERGRVVGTIVSGMLTGILLSRTLSGLLADHFGWRSVYALMTCVTATFCVVMAVSLPSDGVRPRPSYGKLLVSVAAIVGKHPSAKVVLAVSSAAFSIFSAFWTGLTFWLGAPPYSFSLSQVGLMGLVGVVGALAAQRAGWLFDHGHSVRATGTALVVLLASLTAAALGGTNLVVLTVAVLFLDIAIQTINVLNQTRLLSLAPEARSRLNTAFVFCNFLGGALGSSLAGFLWDSVGWLGIMGYCAATCLVAMGVWLFKGKI